MKPEEIRHSLNEKIVTNNHSGWLQSVKICKNKDGFYYLAEILDKNRNSITVVRLEDVEIVKG